MNMIIQFWFVSFLLISVNGEKGSPHVPFTKQQEIYHINLTINNIKDTTGLLRVGIFTSANGYPDQPDLSYSLAKNTLINGQLRLLIPAEGPCEISISVLDDENENGRMDYKFGIMPKEGFGFSNNPKVTSKKAPLFSETSFIFTGEGVRTEINMVYM